MKTGVKTAFVVLAVLGLVLVAGSFLVLSALPASAQAPAAASSADPAALRWAFIGAAAAAGLSSIAAGYAVGMVGSAAVGALAEKPELLGRLLILVGLAEGIAIYGLIVAVMILNRV
jgi:V/A-type H+-transporting ATPase subunit K